MPQLFRTSEKAWNGWYTLNAYYVLADEMGLGKTVHCRFRQIICKNDYFGVAGCCMPQNLSWVMGVWESELGQ
jgi:hypothetical protein